MIALEDITFFDVVVTINQHTFIARGNFFGIFLEPFQLVQATVLLDDDVVPVTRICIRRMLRWSHNNPQPCRPC